MTSTRRLEGDTLPGTPEELALVRRMREGDETAFEMFADHYIPALHRFAAAKLRGQPELTRDLVQTTVCKVIERLDSYRGEASLFTWLAACCRNEIAAHFRRQEGRPVLVEVSDDLSIASMDPEAMALRSSARDLVHRTLDHLPPSYASALEWKYLEGEPVEGIARRLQVSAKAAESLLTRARAAFRSTYEQLTR